MAETSIWDVSRQSYDPAKAVEAAIALGIKTEPTDLELKNDKGVVLKTIKFHKVLFEVPTAADDTPDDRFQRRLAFFEEMQPRLVRDGKVVRENSPLDIDGAHVTSSLDLAMRNGIRTREKAILEGPDKAVIKAAKDLATFKGISYEAALEKVTAAWS